MHEYLWLEILAVLTALGGKLFLTIPKRIGLWVLCISNIAWSTFSIAQGFYFMTFLSIFSLVINCVAIFNWRRKGVGR